ncbi:MAG TPA: hypothetical protein EYQ54_18550 [Myxococcales bacterium]|nr:hypothetical protein [Myxococcales bacterium]
MDRIIKLLLGVIAASLLMGIGIASAQWWNPMESECEQMAREWLADQCAQETEEEKKTSQYCKGNVGYDSLRIEWISTARGNDWCE